MFDSRAPRRFRLCPKGRALTEACFQEHPLDFANTATHTALFSDRSVKIAATHVEEGPAKGWMRMPVPDFDTHPCDYRVPAGEHCQTSCPGCGSPWYAADSACPTNCAKAFPGLPAVASADPHVFTDPLPGANFHEYAIEDELRVPTDLPPGEYVLGWRWDAEMTSQVRTRAGHSTPPHAAAAAACAPSLFLLRPSRGRPRAMQLTIASSIATIASSIRPWCGAQVWSSCADITLL